MVGLLKQFHIHNKFAIETLINYDIKYRSFPPQLTIAFLSLLI
jgi:hypothetical protein